MVDISVLDNLPEISILADEEINLEQMINEMINDYEAKYEELMDEELILYPTDERRILLNIVAGKLFQLLEIINDRFQQNFIKYMYGEHTKNWAANFGFFETGIESAKVKLRFELSEIQDTDVIIPKGTRATAGDNIFFATNENTTIEAGQKSIEIDATCTEAGTVGNDYTVGKINILADPINYVKNVENTTSSAGGHDEYSNDELKEKVINFPNTYSTAGPIGCYEEIIKKYSNRIVDVKVISNNDSIVKIYIMLDNLEIPNEEYRNEVLQYITNLKSTPDTDMIELHAPEKVGFSLKIKYFINDDNKNIQESISTSIQEVTDTFINYTAGKIGRSINPDLLIGYGMAAGASRINVVLPEFQTIEENQIAICESIEIEFGGFEME